MDLVSHTISIETEVPQIKINSNTPTTATVSKYRQRVRISSSSWETCKAYLGSTICKIYKIWLARCHNNQVATLEETIGVNESMANNSNNSNNSNHKARQMV